MYTEHPVFKKIPDDTKIWRYIDFTKFVSLLDSKSLFFIKIAKLDDPFEGLYSKANIKLRPQVYKNRIPDEDIGVLSRSLDLASKSLKNHTFVNSWHINEYESAALWVVYSKADQGIAIQSTFKRLKDSMKDYNEPVFIGPVDYIDYNNEWLPEDNVFYLVVHKRKSFEHEKELRAVIQRLPKEGDNINWNASPIEDGISVPIDLNGLIEKVYVSPRAKKWFLDLLNSITNKYSLNKDIIQSDLADGLNVK